MGVALICKDTPARLGGTTARHACVRRIDRLTLCRRCRSMERPRGGNGHGCPRHDRHCCCDDKRLGSADMGGGRGGVGLLSARAVVLAWPLDAMPSVPPPSPLVAVIAALRAARASIAPSRGCWEVPSVGCLSLGRSTKRRARFCAAVDARARVGHSQSVSAWPKRQSFPLRCRPWRMRTLASSAGPSPCPSAQPRFWWARSSSTP